MVITHWKETTHVDPDHQDEETITGDSMVCFCALNHRTRSPELKANSKCICAVVTLAACFGTQSLENFTRQQKKD